MKIRNEERALRVMEKLRITSRGFAYLVFNDRWAVPKDIYRIDMVYISVRCVGRNHAFRKGSEEMYNIMRLYLMREGLSK